MAFGDRLRAGAISLIDNLRRQKIRTMLLSGDSLETTARIASLLGVDESHAAVTPAGKEEIVRRLRSAGRVVAMARDGINDASALAASDGGIAMGSGTDPAMQAAPVVLLGDNLGRICDTFEIARSTRRVVCQNLFWAFFYNSLGIALAIAGILNPILSAGAMVISEPVRNRQYLSARPSRSQFTRGSRGRRSRAGSRPRHPPLSRSRPNACS